MKKTVLSVVASALALAAFAQETSSSAIVRLLNSRAAGSPKDYAEAAEVVSADAAAGRPLQQFVIAVLSSDAYLPARLRLSKEKRAEYIEKSRDRIRALAEQKNNALAWYLLSLEKNDPKYLKLAADGENVQALNAWGTMTLTDALRNPNMDTNDVERVMVTCFGCFKKAADQGDANGLYNLGMCNLRGLGTPQDDLAAFNFFLRAAKMEHPEAMNGVGLFYREGRGVAKDLKQSVEWFEKSANHDNAFGQYSLARALRNGEGVAQDKARAAELLAKPDAFNAVHDVFYMSCGEGDPRIEHTRAAAKALQEVGAEVIFSAWPGGHEWQPWRKSLHEFCQLIFK